VKALMAAGDYPVLLSQAADRTLRPELLLGTVIGPADAGQALADMDGPRLWRA
jgi:hypothetical protein